MLVVAKRHKHQADEPTPKPNRSGKPLNVWLPPRLLAALEAYCKRSDPKVSKTAATTSALQQWLAQRGYWPFTEPPADEDADGP